MKQILDIGCGINKYKGNSDEIVTGLDKANLLSVDILHNMEDFPYPLKSNTYDKIIMHHSLEHVSKVNNIKIIEEIYRLLKPNGLLIVNVPIGHWFTYDPTHQNYVPFWYWKYFETNFPLSFYSFARFKIIEYKLIDLHGITHITDILKPILSWIYNKNPPAAERIITFFCLDAEVKYTLIKLYEEK
jgi:SAM-dependent methyltransferase